MAVLLCSGRTFGTIIFYRISLQGFTCLPKIKQSQSSYFCKITSLINNFTFLSVQAFQEYQELQQLIQQLQISPEIRDSWTYIWGNSTYMASKFYHLPYKHFQPPRPYIWIWDSKCCNKLKVFVWLLLMDRLNVRNILGRKNFKIQGNNYNCELCFKNVEETTFHLFFTCDFSKKCWEHLHIYWETDLDFFTLMERASQQHTTAFFMKIFILGAWLIWKQRNDHSFNRQRPSFSN
jgi:hypothetical protein